MPFELSLTAGFQQSSLGRRTPGDEAVTKAVDEALQKLLREKGLSLGEAHAAFGSSGFILQQFRQEAYVVMQHLRICAVAVGDYFIPTPSPVR